MGVAGYTQGWVTHEKVRCRYSRPSTFSHTAVRTRRAPEASSVPNLMSVLFFDIVLSLLLGTLCTAATSDFFSLRSTVLISPALRRTARIVHFTVAIALAKGAEKRTTTAHEGPSGAMTSNHGRKQAMASGSFYRFCVEPS